MATTLLVSIAYNTQAAFQIFSKCTLRDFMAFMEWVTVYIMCLKLVEYI